MLIWSLKFVSCWLVFSNRMKESALEKIGSMQILTSEKCRVTLKEWMTASILRNNIVPNAEIITQKMDDCKFSCQNNNNTLQRMDDCHSYCDKNRYNT